MCSIVVTIRQKVVTAKHDREELSREDVRWTDEGDDCR